ncbi:2039_t:CDS:2 [Ambispora leptoticha]|uniref:2039_t:CDS:1 n=1 Tax=Ambispora leptoticha TaxID=144679 RepID=A0A9N8VW48_9GLOM|nr:2039_t:CDS:2 [Ambispora leptoticha]
MKLYVIPLLRARYTYYCHATPKKQTYLSKATNFAASKWDELSHAERTSWKGRLYLTGQKLLDQMDYQEYFLKGVPLLEEWSAEVPMIYPSKIVSPSQINSNLNQLLDKRLPYHRKYMIYSALFVPLSATFTIVPLIPNIPLFYNLFRLYSHYKAYKGAQHLRQVITDNRLSPLTCEMLDTIYKDIDLGGHDDPERMIPEERIEAIAKHFELPALEVDVKRARNQVLNKLAKERSEKQSKSKSSNGDFAKPDNISSSNKTENGRKNI